MNITHDDEMKKINKPQAGEYCNLDGDLNNSSVVYVHSIGKVYATVSVFKNTKTWEVSKYRLTTL